MCQEHNGTRIYTKADHGNSGYWSEELCFEEQALRSALRDALRARLEGPRSLPGSRCNGTLQLITLAILLMTQFWLDRVSSEASDPTLARPQRPKWVLYDGP